MRRYIIVVLIFAFIFGMLIMGFWAIQSRRSVRFSNGYRMYISENGPFITINSEDLNKARIDRFVENNNHWGVGPAVDGYRVYKKVIVGHVSELEYDNSDYKPSYKQGDGLTPGYFIIDPINDNIYRGLTKKAWLKRLRDFGIETEPKLFKPSALDSYFGKNKPS